MIRLRRRLRKTHSAVEVTQPCSMCSINQDFFRKTFALKLIGYALRIRHYNSFGFYSAFFTVGKKGKKVGKSLELSFEHLSGADVESEDNKSGDSALTCESHQPALVSGRRR